MRGGKRIKRGVLKKAKREARDGMGGRLFFIVSLYIMIIFFLVCYIYGWC
jgi:hypothetical protein